MFYFIIKRCLCEKARQIIIDDEVKTFEDCGVLGSVIESNNPKNNFVILYRDH